MTGKQAETFLPQKLWFNASVRALFPARESALSSGEGKARAALSRGIKTADTKYKRQIEANI